MHRQSVGKVCVQFHSEMIFELCERRQIEEDLKLVHLPILDQNETLLHLKLCMHFDPEPAQRTELFWQREPQAYQACKKQSVILKPLEWPALNNSLTYHPSESLMSIV